MWIRGGFPRAFLATDDFNSTLWRESFIRTYLERDIPALGPRIPAETLRRFWTMLAHSQGGVWNASRFARSLAVDGKTVARYLDLLADLLLVRRLPPFHANIRKRLIKSPKVYVRDSGIVHTLLRLDDAESVLGHPVVGGSWEGFAIETLIRAASERARASFFRTAAGAEIDLILELPGNRTWAMEIKRGLAPSVNRGFRTALADLKPDRAFLVHGGDDRYTQTGWRGSHQPACFSGGAREHHWRLTHLRCVVRSQPKGVQKSGGHRARRSQPLVFGFGLRRVDIVDGQHEAVEQIVVDDHHARTRRRLIPAAVRVVGGCAASLRRFRPPCRRLSELLLVVLKARHLVFWRCASGAAWPDHSRWSLLVIVMVTVVPHLHCHHCPSRWRPA